MAIYGPETWREVNGVPFTFWDRWLLRLAVAEERGMDSLVARFEANRRDRSPLSSREDAEAKLAQIADLRGRLAKVELTLAEMLGKEDATDKNLLRKANEKLLKQGIHRPTPAMLDTPRRRLERRAQRGYWPKFPIPPSTFDGELSPYRVDGGCYDWRGTSSLSRQLDLLIEQHGVQRAGDAERLGYLRAILTLIVEPMNNVDDSLGALAETFGEAWKAYLDVSWERTGIEPEVYFRDMIELTIWEDYGLIDHLGAVFQSMAPDDAAVVEDVLDDVISELRAGGFDYQEEKALVMRVDFLVARKLRDRFVGAARELGSRAWRPIVEMGQAAMKAKDQKLALAVFSAADQPGMQRDYLRKQCEEITGAKPATSVLRRVK